MSDEPLRSGVEHYLASLRNERVALYFQPIRELTPISLAITTSPM